MSSSPAPSPLPTGRIPMLERDQVPPEVQAIYDAVERDRGVVPYMHRTIANVPPVLIGLVGFLKPLLADGALPSWYKELIATRVAVLRGCDYCTSSHTAMAKLRGATQEQVDGVWDPEQGPYSEAERLGFRLADRVHELEHGLPDDFYAELKREYNDQQIIELVLTASAFEFTTRMVEALNIPVTPQAGAQLQPSSSPLRTGA
ncbi:MAG TPA: carboxymuconolactone decarboxylase family protein [Gemmatimonadales bacterium]|nr:carboxymuconolactone decarboxylase family protein [Gemmatimonadales bacterium]